jgi:Family of unknown function (DUF6174)
MRTKLKPFFVTVALVALCATASAAQLSQVDQLATAEATWAMNRPHAYEFSFKLLACLVCKLTGPGSEPYGFHVENDFSYLIGAWAARPSQATQGMEKYSTIDKVFVAIHAELARWHDYRFEIDYDPALGYPRRIYFKRFQNAADDDYTIKIEGFKVLVR